MTSRVGQHGISVKGASCSLWVGKVVVVQQSLGASMTTLPMSKKWLLDGRETGLPDVRHIVELGNDGVEEFWSSESALRLDLRTEMSQDDDRRHVGSY